MAVNLSYMVRETGTNLKRNPSLNLASVLTIGVSLFLVGASLLFADGAKNIAAQYRNGVEIIVFLDPHISAAQTAEVGSFIDKAPLVKSKFYVDKQQAYKDFKRLFSNQPDLVKSAKAQDLPTSFNVVPTNATFEVVSQLKSTFSRHPGVYQVNAATDTVRKIQRLTSLLTTGLALTAVCLLAAALMLITNTIHMAALARRREIEVMKLVGATNWFIRIPFMLEGLAQSVIGAVFASGGVYALNRLIRSRLASTESDDVLQHFAVAQSHVVSMSGLLLVIGVVIGVVGSGFAVSRFVDV